jgi:hypothetical protein
LRYSLDSDAIINAWRDYPIHNFPNIWEWVEKLGREQIGGMSEVVFKELERGGDECYVWKVSELLSYIQVISLFR